LMLTSCTFKSPIKLGLLLRDSKQAIDMIDKISLDVDSKTFQPVMKIFASYPLELMQDFNSLNQLDLKYEFGRIFVEDLEAKIKEFNQRKELS